MSDARLVDRVEEGVVDLLAGAEPDVAGNDHEVAALLAVAAQLKAIPNPEFMARLKTDLLDAHESVAPDEQEIREFSATPEEIDGVISHGRTLSGTVRRRESTNFEWKSPLLGSGQYPIGRGSFVASLAAHAAVLALVVTSGIWAAGRVEPHPSVRSVLVTDVSLVLPASARVSHGGGGGGDQDILLAPKGNPPRFALEQLAPPALVVRNEKPKLPVEGTVLGPPALSFPQTSRLGDPLSAVLGPASNGTGSEGGIGTGGRGGVGPGTGPGVGPGSGGGIGDGPYIAGGGVGAPRAIYNPEPDYSEEARKAKYQGIVTLQMIVDAEGRPRDIRVAGSAGMGLDEKAMEAVRQWRFEPGTAKGKPVAVLVQIQVNFRLY